VDGGQLAVWAKACTAAFVNKALCPLFQHELDLAGTAVSSAVVVLRRAQQLQLVVQPGFLLIGTLQL
jgi:hypothetical protein